jgi:Mlc titration factor MtfA (ptsG expression regulator)
MFGLKRRRRDKIGSRPFPSEWLAAVQRNVPYYSLLTDTERGGIYRLVQVFLHEKQFEGCGGLEMTDEIRVTVATQACILLLGRNADVFPTLRAVLVYPHAYVAPVTSRLEDGVVAEGVQERAGESWSHGTLVLSWDGVLEGAADFRDGYNLVFHEFAHQLDYESGAMEGAPDLPGRSMAAEWARIFGREYRALVNDLIRHRPSLLDPYGAENPAEFFAVATEFFFERPIELKARHPALYEQLRLFYKQDAALRMLRHEKSDLNGFRVP